MQFVPFKEVQDFKTRVKFGLTTESSYLDFKAKIDISRDARSRNSENIALDLAAFANTLGGTLLVGVSEKTNKNGLKTADSVCSVENAEDIKSFLNNDVRSVLFPGISFETLILKPTSKTTIVAINVEPSVPLVGVCLNKDRASFSFPYRTEYGNRFYQFFEMERQMANLSGRAMYLKLSEYLQQRQQSDIVLYPAPLVKDVKNTAVKVIQGNSNEFELIINSRAIRLPYSLIEEVWNKSNVGQVLCLKLKERIIEQGKAGHLDIDHPLDRGGNLEAHRKANTPRWTEASLKNMEKLVIDLGKSRFRL